MVTLPKEVDEAVVVVVVLAWLAGTKVTTSGCHETGRSAVVGESPLKTEII